MSVKAVVEPTARHLSFHITFANTLLQMSAVCCQSPDRRQYLVMYLLELKTSASEAAQNNHMK